MADEHPEHVTAAKKLLEKGLPAQAISRIKVSLSVGVKKLWNFVLEAKDLKPYAATGYRIKKIFNASLPLLHKPFQNTTLHEVKNERYFLDIIKQQPKNFAHYDAFGKFYLGKENINDAQDIYQYLVNHQPANADYHARLAYCWYQNSNFAKAAEHYQKSLSLDSTQPNRYYNLGQSLQSAGRTAEAIETLTKALELEPKNPKFLQVLEKLKKNTTNKL